MSPDDVTRALREADADAPRRLAERLLREFVGRPEHHDVLLLLRDRRTGQAGHCARLQDPVPLGDSDVEQCVLLISALHAVCRKLAPGYAAAVAGTIHAMIDPLVTGERYRAPEGMTPEAEEEARAVAERSGLRLGARCARCGRSEMEIAMVGHRSEACTQ